MPSFERAAKNSLSCGAKRTHAECAAEMEALRARIEALCPANVEVTASRVATSLHDAGRNRVTFADADHSRVEWK